jgi:hypothetical protein
MATKKMTAKAAQPAASKAAPKTLVGKKAAPTAPATTALAELKPIKTPFSRTSLFTHLAASAAVEPKTGKAVVAALETTVLASVHKKSLGSFVLPGLLKINVINVPDEAHGYRPVHEDRT